MTAPLEGCSPMILQHSYLRQRRLILGRSLIVTPVDMHTEGGSHWYRQ